MYTSDEDWKNAAETGADKVTKLNKAYRERKSPKDPEETVTFLMIHKTEMMIKEY